MTYAEVAQTVLSMHERPGIGYEVQPLDNGRASIRIINRLNGMAMTLNFGLATMCWEDLITNIISSLTLMNRNFQ